MNSGKGRDMNKDFISGFFCGEGCFARWNVKVKNRPYQIWRICITAHERDIGILKEIREHLGYGVVRRKSSPKANPVYVEYIITRFKEIIKFIEEIGPLLIYHKKRQCEEFYADILKYKKAIKMGQLKGLQN